MSAADQSSLWMLAALLCAGAIVIAAVVTMLFVILEGDRQFQLTAHEEPGEPVLLWDAEVDE